MIAPGEQAPEARVWLTPRDEVQLTEVAEGPYLLLFYLFDWSST